GPRLFGPGLRRSDERRGLGRPRRSRARPGATTSHATAYVETRTGDDLLELVTVRRRVVGQAPRVLDRAGRRGLLQLRRRDAPLVAEPLRATRADVRHRDRRRRRVGATGLAGRTPPRSFEGQRRR